MQMYHKCDSDVASGGLLEMYHNNCNTKAQRTACMPSKATPTMTYDANQLVELYTKCEPGIQLLEMYHEIDCNKGVKAQACSPVVPEGHDCHEGYLMEMYEKCDDNLLKLYTEGNQQILNMYYKLGHAECVQ